MPALGPDLGAELLVALSLLRQQIDDLPRRIVAEMRRTTPSISAADRQKLESLVPVLTAQCASSLLFTVSDLMRQANAAPEVAAALRKLFGIGRGTAKRVGKFLSRCDGAEAGGFRVEATTEVREGMLWKISRL